MLTSVAAASASEAVAGSERLEMDSGAETSKDVALEAMEAFEARPPTSATGPLLLSTLQLQSETQRKLELLDRDIGDVWVVASKVGVDTRPPSSSLDCVSDRAVANLHSV